MDAVGSIGYVDSTVIYQDLGGPQRYPVMVGLLPIVEPVIGDVIVGFRGGVESTVTMTAVEAGLLLWAASSSFGCQGMLTICKAVVRVNDQAPLPVDAAVVLAMLIAPSYIKTLEDASAVPVIGRLVAYSRTSNCSDVIVGFRGC